MFNQLMKKLGGDKEKQKREYFKRMDYLREQLEKFINHESITFIELGDLAQTMLHWSLQNFNNHIAQNNTQLNFLRSQQDAITKQSTSEDTKDKG